MTKAAMAPQILSWAVLIGDTIHEDRFATRDEAETFAADTEGATATPERWAGTLILEETRTEDDREFAANALSWRDLPLPFMFLPETTFGHQEAMVGGTVESIERQEDGRIYGEGRFDLGGEAGREAARLVGDGILRWVSADTVVREFEVVLEGCEGDPNPMAEWKEETEDPEPVLHDGVVYESDDCHEIFRVTEAVIVGITLLAMPAFEGAEIEPASAPAETEEADDDAVAASVDQWHSQPLPLSEDELSEMVAALQAEAEAVTAAAAAPLNLPLRPPVEWFADPEFGTAGEDDRLVLDEHSGRYACPLTVTADGRVFGHIAAWGVCHTGYPGTCMTAPHSATNYAQYRTGEVLAACEDGCEDSIPVGQITIGTGHAPLDMDARAAAAHYDNTGTAVADVASGEDAYGIWVAGMVRPGATPEQIYAMRASSPSGDWRRIGGTLEMLAVLMVNSPGFPVPRVLAASGLELSSERGSRARVRAGRQTALVAAGLVPPRNLEADELRTQIDKLGARLGRVESIAGALKGMAADAIAERLG